MQIQNIISLLTIAIFVLINYNNEVGATKSIFSKRHFNHNKNHIQHHKQHLLRHGKHIDEKIHKINKPLNSNKHQIQHHKQNTLYQNNHVSKSKQHTFNNKRPPNNHRSKLSNRQMQPINEILKSKYCPSKQHLRIIGGNNATEGHFSYVAAIYDCFHKVQESVKNCGIICGGSIISPRHILTAAHCMIDGNTRLQEDMSLVRVGVQNLKLPEVKGTTFRIHKISTHENYGNTDNDVAIIQLKNSITFNHLIKPACINGLNFNYDFRTNRNVIMAGWGMTTQNSNASDVLKYAKLQIYNFFDCYDVGFDKTHRFCANTTGVNDGLGCNGDSGSGLLPLIHGQNHVNVIVGIFSGSGRKSLFVSSGCENPMAFANVTTYAQWINEHV